MKEFDVTIGIAIGLSEEQPYYRTKFEADNAQEVFQKIVEKDWYWFPSTYKTNGKEYVNYNHIQTKHISEIIITEALEG